MLLNILSKNKNDIFIEYIGIQHHLHLIWTVNIFITTTLTQGESKMDSKEQYEAMKELWDLFEENHNIFAEKGNKSAAARARKAINELKKHVTDYKKQSVVESKR
jgi:hypothetical protein